MKTTGKWSKIAFGGLPAGIFWCSPFGFAMVILEHLLSFLVSQFWLMQSITEIALRS